LPTRGHPAGRLLPLRLRAHPVQAARRGRGRLHAPGLAARGGRDGTGGGPTPPPGGADGLVPRLDGRRSPAGDLRALPRLRLPRRPRRAERGPPPVLKERRLWLVVALFVGDTVAAVAALGAAFVVRFWTDLIPAPLGVPPLDPYLLFVLPLVPLHALSMRVVGLYEYRHERTKADEAFLVAQGASLATVLLVASTFFIRTYSYSRVTILLFWVTDIVAVFGSRLGIRDIVRGMRRHGRFVRRALVVGAGPLGQEVVRRLRAHPEFGVRVVGYLDDQYPVGERIEGREVLGGCEAVTRILADYRVDQLFLALPMDAHAEMLKTLNAIEGELLDVKMVPDVLQFVTLRAAVEELEGLPVISLHQSPITGWNRVLKRGTDILLGGLGFLLLSPLLGLIALLVRLTSE